METTELKAGCELDALVAEKVMGWHRWSGDGDYDGPMPCFCAWDGGALAIYTDEVSGDVDHYFSPSTDIAAAWEVLHKDHPDGWFCQFFLMRYGNGYAICDIGDDSIYAEADTAPLAICIAALRACGVNHEKA